MALTKVDDRGLKTPIDLIDNENIRLGTGADLKLFHDGTNSFINNDTGAFILQADQYRFRDKDDGDTFANFIHDGAVELYYDNSKKFETTSTGVTVSGIINSSTINSTGNVEIDVDNGEFRCGAGGDLRISHNGTDNIFRSDSDFIFRNLANNETIAQFEVNGSVDLYYDNNKKFETTSGGVKVHGDLRINDNENIYLGDGADLHITVGSNNDGVINQANGDLKIQRAGSGKFSIKSTGTHFSDDAFWTDSQKAIFGTGSDLEIYHDGSDSYIDNDTGNLNLRVASNENGIRITPNGSVNLYYNGNQKLNTANGGVEITGTCTATTFSGDGIIPAGGIIIWSGASNAIPTGWLLCDGSNSTPDLRNRFVVGAGSSYSVGATGGADSVTLTTAQIPSHNHSIQIRTGRDDDNFSFNQGFSSDSNTDGGTFNSNSTGGGQSHENRPPYYALCYIMKS